MLAELGTLSLILALFISLFQASYLLWKPHYKNLLAPIVPRAATLQTVCIVSAFFILICLRLDSDFSVVNVMSHSNRSLPDLYKIVGSWGNHEGSMLLWILVLSVFGTLFVYAHPGNSITHPTASVQAALSAGILLFILMTSSPFERQFPAPLDGQTLNPILQDIALAIHPPLLYIGYVGFSLVFSLAIAALLTGRADREWAITIHPWIMIAWSSLTLGIGLGSWWAYRELGWGGWWFWDPVENASLLPWLSGTALLHANLVLKKRGLFAQWVVLLSIITFGLSLIGTFLVRSGALTSVHSFASDPSRGLFILAYIALTIGSGLLLYALKAKHLPQSETLQVSSREGMIIINNLFILCSCATVLLGTLYPLIADWLLDTHLSVGAPYFNATIPWLMSLPILAAGLTPFMPWKQASLFEALRRSQPAMGVCFVVVIITLAASQNHILYAAFGFGLSSWLLVSSVQWLVTTNAKRVWPVFFGHVGVAVLIAGITGVSLWKLEKELFITPGDQVAINNYRLLYEGEEALHTGNHQATRATIRVTRDDEPITSLYPEYRTYDISNQKTSETGIYSSWFYDIYTVIGEPSKEDDSKRNLRLYYVPLIRFIWIGFLLLTFAGLLSVIQHRRKA
ncbi:MAG: heme lyase CcmF/NrfE family subunit [Rickettsiales bacterium]|nr:heme lyase CcmF/NrfE family subunit [Rickettsiales bacterium]